MDGSSSSRCVMSSEGGDQGMLATPPGPSATTTTRVLPASGGDGGEPRWTSRLRGLLERDVHRGSPPRSEEHTSELQSRSDLVCRLLLEKKNKQAQTNS